MASVVLSRPWTKWSGPLVMPSKSKLPLQAEVQIENHFEAKVYTTGSAIWGKVSLTPLRDVEFDKVQIDLVGISTTKICGLQRDTLPTKFTFFQLGMPVPQDSLPQNKQLEAKKCVEIPFFFVVPQQRPSSACAHESHLQLPPTMGTWEKNDHSPPTAKIEYSVRVRITPTAKDADRTKLFEMHRCVKILPSNPHKVVESCNENPSKEIRSCSKEGSLRITNVLPPLVYLSPETCKTSELVITARLEFVTETSPAQLPRILAKSASLQIVTNYAQAHIDPSKDEKYRQAVALAHVIPFSKSKKVTINHVEQSDWQTTEASGGSKGINYTATLSISFNMPNSEKTIFLPTFDSCLISRSYSLRMTLATHSSGSGSTMELPLQVMAGQLQDLVMPKLPRYTETGQGQTFAGDVLPSYGS